MIDVDAEGLGRAAETLAGCLQARSNMAKARSVHAVPCLMPHGEADAAKQLGRLLAFDVDAMREIAFWAVVRLLDEAGLDADMEAIPKRQTIRLRRELLKGEQVSLSIGVNMQHCIADIDDVIKPAFAMQLKIEPRGVDLFLSVEPVPHAWEAMRRQYGPIVRANRR